MTRVADQEHLLLWHRIQDRLFVFARAVDDKRFARLADVFTASAVGDYGSGRGHSSCAELIASMEHHLGAGSNCGRSQHNVTNLQVELTDPAHAESRAYFYGVHEGVGPLAGKIWRTWGEYNDLWTHTEAGWRIHDRRYTTYMSEGPAEIVSRTDPGR